MKLSVNDVQTAPHCWSDFSIQEYADKHGDGTYVSAMVILNDPDVKIMDKLWLVGTFSLLSDRNTHILAIEYARHILTEANIRGHRALDAKILWIDGEIDDKELQLAEKEAWDEGKIYTKSKAAAFASKKDPKYAFLLAAAQAGDWFTNAADASELVWQWDTMTMFLKEISND